MTPSTTIKNRYLIAGGCAVVAVICGLLHFEIVAWFEVGMAVGCFGPWSWHRDDA